MFPQKPAFHLQPLDEPNVNGNPVKNFTRDWRRKTDACVICRALRLFNCRNCWQAFKNPILKTVCVPAAGWDWGLWLHAPAHTGLIELHQACTRAKSHTSRESAQSIVCVIFAAGFGAKLREPAPAIENVEKNSALTAPQPSFITS